MVGKIEMGMVWRVLICKFHDVMLQVNAVLACALLTTEYQDLQAMITF